jgi:hypothetical protein
MRIILHLARLGPLNPNRFQQGRCLRRFAPDEHLEQLEAEDDKCDDEKEMNQPASDVKTESEKPENYEDKNDGPQHDESPPKANEVSDTYGVYTRLLTKVYLSVASASNIAG